MPKTAVERPRPLQVLEAATKHKVTLLVAPAGSGKSVLLAQWARLRPSGSWSWLALDRASNDAVQLATRVVQALRSIRPAVGTAALEHLETTGLTTGRAFLDELLDDLHDIDESVLVIEDLHHLTNRALVDELSELIDRAPAQLHFVITSRTEAPLGLRRLAIMGEVMDLGPDVLALDPQASLELVRRVGHVDIGAREIQQLLDRTEGWVAGVQLAALALRGGTDAAALLDGFGGHHHTVADYLTEEVLSHESEEVRRFLVRTSVLDRLGASLCEAVTRDVGGQQMLETLDRRCLFVTRLDGRRRWYRYQRLFRDLLHHKLLAEEPDLEPVLLNRAARWHLSTGDLQHAVEYLIQARAWDSVNDVIIRYGRELWERGEAATVVRWMESVPEAAATTRPDERVAWGFLYATAGRTRTTDHILSEIDASPRATPGVRVVADVVTALCVPFDIPPRRAIEAADRALAALQTSVADELPDVLGIGLPARLELAALTAKGRALFYDGQIGAARDAFDRAAESPGMSFAPFAVGTLGSAAHLEATAGRLDDAKRLARRALALASEADVVTHAVTAEALLALGRICCERGENDDALFFVEEAMARAQQNRRWTLIAACRVELGMLLLSQGEWSAGLDSLEIDPELPSVPRGIAAQLRALEARLLIGSGDLERARRVLTAEPGEPDPELLSASVQLAIAERDLVGAQKLLAGWPEDCELRLEIERLVWLAVLEDLSGHPGTARERMHEAVTLSEREGHHRIFVGTGREVRRVLRSLQRAQPSAFLQELIEGDVTTIRKVAPELVEQMSDRELVVLRHLRQSRSNAQLAADLYVSINTVKTHLKHIYTKLGVTSRDEAVRAAEALGLI